MLTKSKLMLTRIKCLLIVFAGEERGDFGIGQIAAIVAGIVIIGVIISAVTGNMQEWIGQVWDWISELFDSAL